MNPGVEPGGVNSGAEPHRDGRVETRIFLRPVGSPLTIGMSGLAIASLLQSGLDLRWIPLTQSHDVGLILLSVPFALQLIACIFAYLSRDGAAGASLGVLSLSWFALGLIHATSAPGARSGALALTLIAAGGVLILSCAAIATTKPLPGTAFGLSGIRFILTGVYLLSGVVAWRHVVGIIGLVILALAAYCVVAFELEGEHHHPVLPTLRRVEGRAAVSAPELPSRIKGVTREAGVRHTT